MIIKREIIIVTTILTIAFCGSFLPSMLSTFFERGYFEPNLPTDLAPTAQWLLKYPERKPPYIESIAYLPRGSCIRIYQAFFGISGDRADYTLMGATRLLINGQRLSVEQAPVYFNTLGMLENQVSVVYSICTIVILPPGLHLFELQIRDNPLGDYDLGEIFSYQWAYEVR